MVFLLNLNSVKIQLTKENRLFQMFDQLQLQEDKLVYELRSSTEPLHYLCQWLMGTFNCCRYSKKKLWLDIPNANSCLVLFLLSPFSSLCAILPFIFFSPLNYTRTLCSHLQYPFFLTCSGAHKSVV
jgi:hypothetical protein